MILSWLDAEKPGGVDLTQPVRIASDSVARKDVVSIEALQVNLHGLANHGVCHIDGSAHGFVVYHCVRCLDEFRESLRVPIHEVFSRYPLTSAQEEEDVVYEPGDEIVLDPFVLQAVILGLKYQPICKEDCAGLCPSCGVNLNHNTCHCKDRTIDPRLEALAELLDKTNEDRRS